MPFFVTARLQTLATTTICHFQIKSFGLQLYAYTFKNELDSLCWNDLGEPRNEYDRFHMMGLDGYFSDYPNTGHGWKNGLNGAVAIVKLAPIHLLLLIVGLFYF